jgi:hypothetical protein
VQWCILSIKIWKLRWHAYIQKKNEYMAIQIYSKETCWHQKGVYTCLLINTKLRKN